jgi:hypothetical protein
MPAPDHHDNHDNHDRQDTATVPLRMAVAVRVLGVACVWLATGVAVEVARRAAPALNGPVVTVVEVLLLVVAAAIAFVGVWLLVRRGPGLVLDADGMHNRTNWRRDSPRTVRWRDVSDVRLTAFPGGPVVVVTLADGRRSLIAARLLDLPVATLEEEIRARLNAAHGYRPLG